MTGPLQAAGTNIYCLLSYQATHQEVSNKQAAFEGSEKVLSIDYPLAARKHFRHDVSIQTIHRDLDQQNVHKPNRVLFDANWHIFVPRLTTKQEDIQLLPRYAATKISYHANTPEPAYHECHKNIKALQIFCPTP